MQIVITIHIVPPYLYYTFQSEGGSVSVAFDNTQEASLDLMRWLVEDCILSASCRNRQKDKKIALNRTRNLFWKTLNSPGERYARYWRNYNATKRKVKTNAQ